MKPLLVCSAKQVSVGDLIYLPEDRGDLGRPPVWLALVIGTPADQKSYKVKPYGVKQTAVLARVFVLRGFEHYADNAIIEQCYIDGTYILSKLSQGV